MKKTSKIDIDYHCAKVTYDQVVETTKKAFQIENRLPVLPLKIWNQIVAFLCHISKTNDSEAVVSLTVVNDEWHPIVWHQETPGALHVDFDESSDENQLLLTDEVREALQTVHCTIHSHNKAAASQSSNDRKDEESKNGWHVTVGNCNLPKHTSHCRFNVFHNAQFEEGKKVREAHQEFIVTDVDIITEELPEINAPAGYMKTKLEIMTSLVNDEFPEEWKERVTKPIIYKKGYQGKVGYQHAQYHNAKKSVPVTYPPTPKKNHHQKSKDSGKDGLEIDTNNLFTQYILDEKPNWLMCQFLYQETEALELMNIIEAASSQDLSLRNILGSVRKLTADYMIRENESKNDIWNELPTIPDMVDMLIDSVMDQKEALQVEDYYGNSGNDLIVTDFHDKLIDNTILERELANDELNEPQRSSLSTEQDYYSIDHY